MDVDLDLTADDRRRLNGYVEQILLKDAAVLDDLMIEIHKLVQQHIKRQGK